MFESTQKRRGTFPCMSALKGLFSSIKVDFGHTRDMYPQLIIFKSGLIHFYETYNVMLP